MHRSTTARTGVLLVAPSGSTATAVEPDGRRDVDIPAGSRMGFSLDGRSASLWVDRRDGSGWQLVGDTVLRSVPDFTDEDVRSQWRYAFSLRSLAGETLTATAFEGRTRH